MRRITINVYEHPIQIDIEPEEEEIYRKAEKELRLMLNNYANMYEKVGREVILASAAYELMFNSIVEKEKLEKLEQKIDKVIEAEGIE